MAPRFFTINPISESIAKKAHYTSAKLDRKESEFDRMKLNREFIDGFQAPFVEESAVKIGMKHLQNLTLPNGCIFIIGSVELVVFPDQGMNDLGQLDLSQYDGVGISGLNTITDYINWKLSLMSGFMKFRILTLLNYNLRTAPTVNQP